jgi:hypothetical protein
MCILQGEPCLIISKGVTAPGVRLFFEKYFVFTTPQPFGIIFMQLSTKNTLPLDLAFSLKNSLPSHFFLNPLTMYRSAHYKGNTVPNC